MILGYINLGLFGYNNYLAVNKAKLLLYIIKINIWLSKHYNTFDCWYVILRDSLLYIVWFDNIYYTYITMYIYIIIINIMWY